MLSNFITYPNFGFEETILLKIEFLIFIIDVLLSEILIILPNVVTFIIDNLLN